MCIRDRNFTSFTAGVATNVPLLYDLTGSAMRNTLSPVSTTSAITSRRVTVSACASTLSTSVGYINTTSVESVASITVDVPGTYVVCALTAVNDTMVCLLYTSPSPRDRTRSRMPSSA
eukprot:TRINITY_DN10559_c0_g1_i1.p1 TRINITY_DN10559_c0_g1~~TRINITY_DN10559_c0_g1_i1.p1  ORF type:complete len:118 (+),score=41.34 TRINITY_DN10559_c0_g1_i1:115-468(+)